MTALLEEPARAYRERHEHLPAALAAQGIEAQGGSGADDGHRQLAAGTLSGS